MNDYFQNKNYGSFPDGSFTMPELKQALLKILY